MRLSNLVRLCLLIAALPIGFSACVKDSCRQLRTYSWYEPIYKTKDEVRANIKSNPAKEVERPGKLFILGNYIFLNDVDKGVHIIDNSNPAAPRNVAFIDIPGNLDIAVKGNTLYADLYSDLVTLDISNPLNVQVKKITEDIFRHRSWGGGFVGPNGTDNIIVDWIRKDTTVTEGCDNSFWFRNDVFLSIASSGPSPAAGGASPIGQGGSMARFTIMNDRLYTVGTYRLDIFNIINPVNPIKVSDLTIGWNIETIFPFQDKLFIGSMSGMYIYSVSNPDAPVKTGDFVHAQSCDPVIADNNYAYVTLRSGTTCQGFTNQLEIVQLNGMTNPTLIKTYQMKNPKGLSKDGNYLFLCDDGLKIYNAADVNNLVLVKHIKDGETFDVIAYNNIALVVGENGLYQYDYSSMANIRLLSKINVTNP